MSASSADKIDEVEENVKPPPKKRGRKRKSEILAQKIEEIIEKSPEVEVVSRRGRPRKKVNYFELANPDNVEEFPLQQIREQERYFNLLKEEDVEKKKRKRREKEPSEESFTESVDIEENQLKKGLKQDKNDIEMESLPQTDVNQSTETSGVVSDEEPSTSTKRTKNKDRKYNYTGETVKMMNTLFNIFSNNSDGTETNESINLDSTNENQLHSEPKSDKRRYTKQKKTLENQDMNLDDSIRNVTCAVCNAVLDKNTWRHHKQKLHNNLAWRVGDPPLDLNDQTLVMKILNSLYKEKKSFKCHICLETKKSVVGFLSHRSQCSKSMNQIESIKVACEICDRKVLPVSLSIHMKMHSTPKEVKAEKHNEPKPLSSRRSATKRNGRVKENVEENKIEEHFTTNLDFSNQEFVKEIFQNTLDDNEIIECIFKCSRNVTDLEDALKHFAECTEKPTEGFACKKCLLIVANQEDIISHLNEVHSINHSVGNGKRKQSPERCDGNVSFLTTTLKYCSKALFGDAFQWTLKFQEDYYSQFLFENLMMNDIHWRVLPPKLVVDYLPKLDESCDVAQRHVTSFINPLTDTYTFKKYKLFESELHIDNKVTIFCGGPVSSLAWLPTPYDQQCDQVLATSVLSSPDSKYVTSDNFFERGAIQFWSFGSLNNKMKTLKEPLFLFGLAVDFGPIWHMEWCPSGCFNTEKTENRMGLLAVTGSDSFVYIYAIPRVSEENCGLFYKTKPLVKLVLQQQRRNFLGSCKYYPTKLSWSKARGHDYLAVGYSNGLVALYNLKSSSKLLLYMENEVACILPTKSFQAHSHAVTALTLYHLNGGCRWLLTASFDRDVCVWDLQNYSYPIYSNRKNIITDGIWLTNWLCNVVASDQGSTGFFVLSTLLNQVRDFASEPNLALCPSYSTITAISSSDWLNGILHVNSVGETLALFPHQILKIPEKHKTLKTKRLLFGYTHLIEKGKTKEELIKIRDKKNKLLSTLVQSGSKSSYPKVKAESEHMELLTEPLSYEDADKKYSLLFCDNRLESYGHDFPKTTLKELSAFSKCFGSTAPNRYPLTAINKVAFNPNRQASLYFATGYQAGFVRVMWMEFLKNDEQIK